MSGAADPETKLDPWDDHDLREVEIWSVAALARMRTLARLMGGIQRRGGGPLHDEAVLLLGEAGFAVVALYLMLEAVRRYSARHEGVLGPIPDVELTDLLARAKRGRDAVVHFEDKLARSPTAQLAIAATEGITITSPPHRAGTADQVDLITWTEMERAARAALRWLHSRPAPAPRRIR